MATPPIATVATAVATTLPVVIVAAVASPVILTSTARTVVKRVTEYVPTSADMTRDNLT
jgi:hypothetical protein